ncbi:unnamed protein product [Leptidea sinapis]|uniref:Uncharacterized protein n=1 Tax=Leptidea sinapis TaxID=189913 RepID=A0A5E4R750_9NEOP|nr:unnamed protein product [Leptidea sinapis]
MGPRPSAKFLGIRHVLGRIDRRFAHFSGSARGLCPSDVTPTPPHPSPRDRANFTLQHSTPHDLNLRSMYLCSHTHLLRAKVNIFDKIRRRGRSQQQRGASQAAASTTFRHSKLRYSSHFPARGSPLRVRTNAAQHAATPRLTDSADDPGSVGLAERPGYGYEALSAASDASDQAEPDADADDIAESWRGSTRVNFPPHVELEQRATGSSLHRSRGRSMSAWSDISRSSIRFEER